MPRDMQLVYIASNFQRPPLASPMHRDPQPQRSSLIPAEMVENQNIHGNMGENRISFLKVKKLSENAILPSRETPDSAGFNLSTSMETKVPAQGKALVSTDISIAVPENTYARIAPRLGLAWKQSLGVGAGVVDSDYRGPVGVILFNHSDSDFVVKVGDQITQIIVEDIMTTNLVVAEVEDHDDATVGGVESGMALLKVKRLSQNAVLPSRGSPFSAGCDLYSAVETKVPARGRVRVSTDLSIVIPEGTFAHIAPRSGLAWKQSIHVVAAVDRMIGTKYQGPIDVILINHSDLDFEVKVGDRIAQIIIIRVMTPDVAKVEDCCDTVRGAAGFGLTGMTTSMEEPTPKLQKLHHDKSQNVIAKMVPVENGIPLLRVKEISRNATLPSRASAHNVSYDLFSAVETTVPARGKSLVSTDVSLAIPQGTYARISPRSELTWKHSIDVAEEVIDADYRGPVELTLSNFSNLDFKVKVGDWIGQMVLVRIMAPEATNALVLDDTVRGDGGFGSTGV